MSFKKIITSISSATIRSVYSHVNTISWPNVEILKVSNSIAKTFRNGCSIDPEVDKQ